MEASNTETTAGHPVKGIGLKDLEFGHRAPGGGINDRVTGRDAEVDELAASIENDGILQNIAIWDSKAPPYYVIAGNRRLAALRLLHKTALKAGRDVTVMCVAIDAMDINDALGKAMASNMHIPPHPVDQFETFARLVDGGMTAAGIATRYGIGDVKTVERSLALGKLAPEIRKAWRENKLRAEDARVFTLEPDQAKQAAIYEKLKKGHSLYAHSIRNAILGDTGRLAKLLKFVGLGAYEKAGGTFRIDLFPDPNHRGLDKIPQDAPIIQKLAADKLAAECERLLKAGWAWADAEAPASAEYQWTSISGNSRKSNIPKTDKAKSGCIVRLSYDGTLDIFYGLIRPKDAKAVAAGKDAKADKPKPAKTDPKALSSALTTRLDRTLMAAVQDMLDNEAASSKPGLHPAAFKMLAGLIQPERHSWSAVKVSDCVALRDAAGAHARGYLLKHFDAKDYFGSIPTKLTLKLLKDEIPYGSENVDKMGKTQLVEVAAKHAKAAKWLPLQLRPAEPKKKAR